MEILLNERTRSCPSGSLIFYDVVQSSIVAGMVEDGEVDHLSGRSKGNLPVLKKHHHHSVSIGLKSLRLK